MPDGITNIKGAFYISNTAQNSDLTESQFSALSYTLVPYMGNHGDTGVQQNIVSYPVWDNVFSSKGKGAANAGDPVVEFQDVVSAGMDLLIAAADPDNINSYATKIVWSDGSIEYNRGVITGPVRPKGGNEDFKRLQFSFGYSQAAISVAA